MSGEAPRFGRTSLISSDCTTWPPLAFSESAGYYPVPERGAFRMHSFEIQVELSSGRIVSITELHVARTYACLLEGAPDASYNELIIKRARRRMVPIWNERPTYVVPPVIRTISEAGRTYPRQPEIEYYVWLDSEPLSPERCCSQLVAI